MITFIEGTVVEKRINELVMQANGIGYLLFCGANTIVSAPEPGQTARIYTYLNVREDAMELFGFISQQERSMFERLLSVSGVGPRTALNVISSMPLKDLMTAIVFGDVKALSRAQGIGLKTAQRIALELKEKVSESDIVCGLTGADTSMPPVSDAAADAVLALISWGYSSAEARSAVNKVRSQTADPGELIKLALREISGGFRNG